MASARCRVFVPPLDLSSYPPEFRDLLRIGGPVIVADPAVEPKMTGVRPAVANPISRRFIRASAPAERHAYEARVGVVEAIARPGRRAVVEPLVPAAVASEKGAALTWTRHAPRAFLGPVSVRPLKPAIVSLIRLLEAEGVLDDALFRELHHLTGPKSRDETIGSHVAYLRRGKRPTYRRGPANRLGSLTCAVRVQVLARRLGRLCARQGGRLCRVQVASAVRDAQRRVTPERVLAALDSGDGRPAST